MRKIGLGLLALVLLAIGTGSASAHKYSRRHAIYEDRYERDARRHDVVYERRGRRGERRHHRRWERDCCERAARSYERRHARRHHARRYAYAPRVVYEYVYVPVSRYPQYPPPPPQREYQSETLPTGSRIWWDQMMREGRAGEAN
jgi:hypothetical protein